ncbi:hypothetical protein AURDEDRAFT_164408 [Auricularia subglabra TFB-10046 SS5]|nr:hypothetical protein AURDEDRAFT_164408 [Auricularia subglabra TFB-10046 SS5]
MSPAGYVRLRESDGAKDETSLCKQSNRLLILACVVAAGSLILSLAQLLAVKPPSRVVQSGVLRRPNAYVGLDKVAFPANDAFKPFHNYPRAIYQVTVGDASHRLTEEDRQWMSEAGTVVPEDHHFLVTRTRSSVVQFRAMDWGTEHCTLRMDLPPSNSTMGAVDIWKLESDKELLPHILWKAPRRLELMASRRFEAGKSAGTLEFSCESGSFPTFEFTCSAGTSVCEVDFWQDRTRSSEEAWTPDESADALWAERSNLDGVFIGAVAYGVHATLFFMTLKLLWARPRTTWKDYTWIAYVIVLFTLSSIGNGAQLKFAQMTYIDDRNYPGGPAAFYTAGSTAFMAVFCNSIYTANTWLQDGLLLYRFWIIFGGGYLLIALPALIYAASVGLGCVVIFMLSRPGMTIWSAVSLQLITVYWAVSIAFNILLTVAIVARLLATRRRVGRRIATAGPYVTVSAMLVESAFLYSACGIAFLVAYGADSPVQNLILPTLAQMQSVAPMLIIMRVAQGRAWSPSTSVQLPRSTFSFGSSGGDSQRTAASTQLGIGSSSSYIMAEKVAHAV